MLFLLIHHIGHLIGIELTGGVNHLLQKGDSQNGIYHLKAATRNRTSCYIIFHFQIFFAKQNGIDSMHFTSLLNDVRE